MTSTIITMVAMIAEWSAIATERWLSRLAASFPEPAPSDRGQSPVTPTEPAETPGASGKARSPA
jgi:hypothetical protein